MISMHYHFLIQRLPQQQPITSSGWRCAGAALFFSLILRIYYYIDPVPSLSVVLL